jgi:hypothetical protein
MSAAPARAPARRTHPPKGTCTSTATCSNTRGPAPSLCSAPIDLPIFDVEQQQQQLVLLEHLHVEQSGRRRRGRAHRRAPFLEIEWSWAGRGRARGKFCVAWQVLRVTAHRVVRARNEIGATTPQRADGMGLLPMGPAVGWALRIPQNTQNTKNNQNTKNAWNTKNTWNIPRLPRTTRVYQNHAGPKARACPHNSTENYFATNHARAPNQRN